MSVQDFDAIVIIVRPFIIFESLHFPLFYIKIASFPLFYIKIAWKVICYFSHVSYTQISYFKTPSPS